ncbi:MAG: Hsp20/alpha crystallin family protein [Theionarchaea archaeon]|nr:Hsp20/alpha crystallin family protein [Theionarchaea archaeon]
MESDIFDEMRRMQEEMERMFNTSSSCTSCQRPGSIPDDRRPGSIPQNPRPIPGRMGPVVDVLETDTTVIVIAEVQSMEKEDIDLKVTSEQVVIDAKNDEGHDGGGFHVAVPLPAYVKSQDATATCKNGVLEIILLKDKEVSKSQDIKIK